MAKMGSGHHRGTLWAAYGMTLSYMHLGFFTHVYGDFSSKEIWQPWFSTGENTLMLYSWEGNWRTDRINGRLPPGVMATATCAPTAWRLVSAPVPVLVCKFGIVLWQIVSFVQILVHGTVLCRRGVLFLTADNVTVYGGEVDALLETSQQQQLVSNRLYVSCLLLELFVVIYGSGMSSAAVTVLLVYTAFRDVAH